MESLRSSLTTIKSHFRFWNFRIILILFIISGLTNSFRLSAQEQFSRNLETVRFIPKGQWITGVSVNYSQSNQDNYQFLVIEKFSGDSYTFKLSPMVMYAFHDDLAAGGRVSYARSLTRINNTDVVFGEDAEFNVDNLYNLSHTIYSTLLFRNYFSLGKSTRFGMFNEIQVQYGFGQSKLATGSGDALTGTYSTTNSINIGLTPGFIAFLNNYSAIEVNIGVLGFNYSKTRAITDQIYVGEHTTSSANFRINLFSITFGVVFYL